MMISTSDISTHKTPVQFELTRESNGKRIDTQPDPASWDSVLKYPTPTGLPRNANCSCRSDNRYHRFGCLQLCKKCHNTYLGFIIGASVDEPVKSCVGNIKNRKLFCERCRYGRVAAPDNRLLYVVDYFRHQGCFPTFDTLVAFHHRKEQLVERLKSGPLCQDVRSIVLSYLLF